MENGLLVKTKEGSPQGGPLSPLLANIYLNEYDWEMARRGVPVIRYADDIMELAPPIMSDDEAAPSEEPASDYHCHCEPQSGVAISWYCVRISTL